MRTVGVILSKRSASKDLRTYYLHSSLSGFANPYCIFRFSDGIISKRSENEVYAYAYENCG